MLGESLRSKFGQDMIWNVASFGVLAVCGVALNVIIARFYGSEALGVFNQVFALYILLSQIAVFGMQFSVLKYVAEFSEDRATCNAVITSGLIISGLFATGTCILSLLSADWLGNVLESPGVAEGWTYAVPGLWCITLNKVLLAVLNGFRRMKAFAVVVSMRYILMVVALIGCMIFGTPGNFLAILISSAEAALLLFLILYSFKFFAIAPWRSSWNWTKKHLHFGARGFFGGIISEFNTRVDILMLGYFVTDRLVGIYSLASLMAEGLGQLSVVLRSNLNPLLTQYITQGKIPEVLDLIRRSKRIFYLVMAIVGTVAVAVYPVFLGALVSRADFGDSRTPFAILVLGIMLSAGYLPLDMILVQAGFPGAHTVFKALIVGSNVILTAALVPHFGLCGAASATAIAYLLSILFLKVLVYLKMSLRI